MDEIQKIYHDISTVDDINKYLSNTDDGESGIIEFKAVDRLSDEKDKSKKANFRAKIAKEMCAFANSEGGILVVGVKVENGKVVPSCKEPNLEDFLEKQKIGTYLEPSLKGLNFKSLGVEDGSNKPVIIMIPKSDFLPHRTINNYSGVDGKNKDIVGEYFVREGSDSHKLPEQLVRAMYLSLGRAPRFEIVPVIKFIKDHNRKVIDIQALVYPDKYKFIDKYYFSAKLKMYDEFFDSISEYSSGKDIFDISILMDGERNKKMPIYPSDEDKYAADCIIKIRPMSEIDIYMQIPNNEIALDSKKYDTIKYIIIDVVYACEGMSAVKRRFGYVFDVKDFKYYNSEIGIYKFKYLKNVFLDSRLTNKIIDLDSFNEFTKIGFHNGNELFKDRFGFTEED
jgi:divergent AAA domain